MYLAVPFAAQHRARPKLRSAPAQVRGALSRFLGGLRAIEEALALAIKIAEMIRLESVGENTKQQVARQVNGRSPTKHRVPTIPQFTDVEFAQTCDFGDDRLPVRQCRTDLDPRHS